MAADVSAPVMDETTSAAPRVREGGVYLITGGQGEIGLELAAWLAAQASDVKLVLANRQAADDSDSAAAHPAGIARLEAAGPSLAGRLRRGGRNGAGGTAERNRPSLRRLARRDSRGRQLARRDAVESHGRRSGRRVAGQAGRGLAVGSVDGQLPLDWLAVCSSLAALDPVAGQAAYAAANAGADALMLARARGVNGP